MTRLLIHPGEHLADELQALDMSANELAKELGVPTNRLTEIIRGKRGISGDTALRLGHFFGTSPEFWMNLQKLYELRLAEKKSGETIKDLPTLAKSDRLKVLLLEELGSEIKKGLDNGEATPLDIKAIKARGRKRLAAEREK